MSVNTELLVQMDAAGGCALSNLFAHFVKCLLLFKSQAGHLMLPGFACMKSVAETKPKATTAVTAIGMCVSPSMSVIWLSGWLGSNAAISGECYAPQAFSQRSAMCLTRGAT